MTPASNLRLGCDLCQIATMERMLKDEPASMERLFASEERHYAMRQTHPAQHFAGVFAVKEAFAKAIRNPALLGKYHREVVVDHVDGGVPALRCSEALAGALAHQGLRVADCSITHDGDYAMAVVLVEMVRPASVLRCARCVLTLDYLQDQGVTDALLRLEDTQGTPRYLCPPCFKGW